MIREGQKEGRRTEIGNNYKANEQYLGTWIKEGQSVTQNGNRTATNREGDS